MKNIFAALLLLCCSVAATAQHWQPLGPNDFNNASYEMIGFTPGFAVSPDGQPAVHYGEQAYYNYLGSLRIFDGTSWQYLGPRAYGPSVCTGPLITYDTSGTLYLYGSSMGTLGVVRRQGQTLVPVGSLAAAMSQALIGNPASLTTDLSGAPYLAYMDNSSWTSNHLYLNKYVNGNWMPVGGGIAPLTLQLSQVTVRVSRQGVPFVAYKDDYAGGYLRVKKFDGTNWVFVGSANISGTAATDIDMAIDTGGAPVVTYTDGNTTFVKRYAQATNSWAILFQYNSWGGYLHPNIEIGSDNVLYFEYHNNHFFTVKKWVNNAWADLPMSSIKVTPGFYSNMQLDKLCRPYLVYTNSRLGVLRFNGSGWENIGEPGFTGWNTDQFDMALTRGGQPYVTYVDRTESNKLTTRKFDGTNWILVGNPGFNTLYGGTPSMEMDSAGVPYVAYLTDDNRPAVLTYNGTAWVAAGNLTQSFQPGNCSHLSMAFDRVTNRPCIALRTYPGEQTLVVRYNGSSWDTLGGIATPQWTGASTLAIDNNGTPWVAYLDIYGFAAVNKLVGNSWTPVGLPANQTASRLTLAIGGPDNQAYLCYFNNNYQPVVRKLTSNNTWSLIGGPAPTLNTGSRMALTVSRNGTLYAAARTDTARAAVMRLQGNTWHQLPAGLEVSAGEAMEMSLDLDTNGYPYLAYDNGQIYVKTYDGCVANPALAGAACLGSTVQLVSNDAVSHVWTGPNGFSSSAQSPSFPATNAAAQSGWYRVTITGNNCTITDSVLVTIHPAPAAPLISTASLSFCQPDTISLTGTSSAAVHYSWSRNGVTIAGAASSLLRVNTSGSYRLRISDQFGCSAESDSLPVTAHPQPQPLILQSGDTLSTGPFAAYQWFLNGQLLAGAADDTLIATASGTYTVQVTDANGCTGQSAALPVTISPNAIPQLPSGGIVIYPSPANDRLYIRTSLQLNAVLYNSLGQKVLAQPSAREIDVRMLPNGPYLLWLYLQNGTPVRSQQLMIEH